ncbi:MAG TPA: M28 family metallopeptidase [Steroidobacteraceae bacterium]|jgi:Zn-dependent M28 family amino/carboxypeptidase|nr:M28 family metallopeptidase [Steroidobacteraceae bacterium]
MRYLLFIGALSASAALAADTAVTIDPERLSQTVKILASDEFEGRGPATPGETKTIEWLTKSFRDLGLEPAGERGSWTQAVPLVRTQIGSPATMSIAIQGKDRPLTQSKDIYVSTVRNVDRVSIKVAPLVFVGYGVTAPERQWDDYKQVDLHGKIAVYLVNDPDFYAKPGEPVAGRFGDRRMTYYGRWTYKYEEAARRGALGALIVHDTDGAGYGWSTVTAPAGENYDIVRDKRDERVLLQGWLASAAANELFKSAGLDLAALSVQARRADFKPVELASVRFNADLPVTAKLAESRNFLARIRGSKRPDETIMFAAHWDAYGIGPPDAQGHAIRPGANDDALGLAGVLELARVFKAGPQPERTLVFAAWTAEERGLLGSQVYAAKPLYPLEKTVANLTLDILQTAGLAKDVLLVGAGQSELEDDLARAAAAQGRVVTPESLPERGLFYRADHFPLARQGVPVLLLMGISGATDLREGGREAGNRWLESYMRCYHQTCDAWSASLDFRGAAQDVELFHTMGKSLANSTRWPQWRTGSEFFATRAKSNSQRR